MGNVTKVTSEGGGPSTCYEGHVTMLKCTGVEKLEGHKFGFFCK